MSLAPSRPAPPRGYNGKIPKQVWDIVTAAWETGVAVSSNRARDWSAEIALAASLGWISTVSLDGRRYCRTWNVTVEGVIALQHIKELR